MLIADYVDTMITGWIYLKLSPMLPGTALVICFLFYFILISDGSTFNVFEDLTLIALDTRLKWHVFCMKRDRKSRFWIFYFSGWGHWSNDLIVYIVAHTCAGTHAYRVLVLPCLTDVFPIGRHILFNVIRERAWFTCFR